MSNLIISMCYIYVFIIGMCLSSFFKVVGYRIPKNEAITGRSKCDVCHHPLKWWQIFPVFSYLILRGKCHYCHSKIGLNNPIFELLIGILFVLSAYLLSFDKEMLVSFTFICLLYTVSVSDVIYRIIPNKVLLPFLIIGIVGRVLIPQNELWWYPFAGFIIGFFPLFFVKLVREQAIGGGDIKLFGVIGVFIGPIGVAVTLIVSSILALIFYIFYFLLSKKRQRQIPFGPFIAIGAYIVYMFISGQVDIARIAIF